MMDLNLLPEDVLITGEAVSRIVTVSGKQLDPRPSQKVRNHSPDGFNWGYGGSGPAQLALAILLHFMPEEDAQTLYQIFKFSVVGELPQGRNFIIHLNLREELKKIVNKKETDKLIKEL